MKGYILFHQLKHHLGYIKAWIEAKKGSLADETVKAVKTLGTRQLDLYYGTLAVDDILQQASHWLLQAGITSVEQYRQWVGGGYRFCTLGDGSVFTLRYVNNAKPVHIHPARYAPHTLRIKANALKTAVCLMLIHDNDTNVNIARLNALRKQYLDLPPIGEKADISEIEKAAGLLGRRGCDTGLRLSQN